MSEEQNPVHPNRQQRACKECGTLYTIEAFYQSSQSFFDPPDRYSDGCHVYCLSCWLGVGPKDFPPMEDDDAARQESMLQSGLGDQRGLQ